MSAGGIVSDDAELLGNLADRLQSVEDVWPEKLEYSMSIANKGVVFGSPIRVDFKLVPLVKGLSIGSISSYLVEFRHLQSARCYKKNQTHRVIAQDEWTLSDGLETVDIDGRDGHRFHRWIQVPKSLTGCLQTVSTRGIEAKHIIIFVLRLRNPDGHQSKV